MYDWIIGAVGLGIGIMGLGVYLKENFEAKKKEKELNDQIKSLQEEIAKGQLIGKKRVMSEDKQLIITSQKEVWILGINALGPLHECYEELISLLKKGGRIKVLLLNPASKAFKQREKDEEELNGKIVGRLCAEYNASLSICRSILHFSAEKGEIKLKVHDNYPEHALIIRDPRSDTCKIHINYYPKEKLTRGYIGEHRAILQQWPDLLGQWISKYEDLWQNAHDINLNIGK